MAPQRPDRPEVQGNVAQVSESELRRRKQTLDRAKANHLSRQLQMRLQYARLKVDHGWQKQNLNEVENLYFHHSHKRPSTSFPPTPTNSNLMPSLTHPTSLPPQSQASMSFKPKPNPPPPVMDPSAMDGLQTMDSMKTMLDIEMSVPPPPPSNTTMNAIPGESPDIAETTTAPLPPNKTTSSQQPTSASGDAEASSSTATSPQKRPQPPHNPNPPTYHPPSLSSTPPESTSTFRVAPKRPRHNHQSSSFSPSSNPLVGNGGAGGNGSSEAAQTQRQSAYGLASGAALTYDSFWSSHGTGSGRSTPTPAGQARTLVGVTGGLPAPVRGRSFGGGFDGIVSAGEGGRGREGVSGGLV